MEEIYRGILDGDRFFREADRGDEKKVREILERFDGLLKTWPSETIEEAGRIPREMLDAMGKAGLFGISIPQAYGGLDLGLRDLVRVVDAVSEADMSSALAFLAHLLIGVKAIDLYGTEEQKRKYLRPAAAGEMIFSY
ncbi:MAG TPA: acyl-CoA dehydrogenase family protein, partial [Syntrophales bacterium]|nr:acyl-CoA dehydrogenase family protein [Syntrophales bacterium]